VATDEMEVDDARQGKLLMQNRKKKHEKTKKLVKNYWTWNKLEIWLLKIENAKKLA
jgi:hypothetical protein